jgi:phosphoglycerate dehydrogenase-like enzyme
MTVPFEGVYLDQLRAVLAPAEVIQTTSGDEAGIAAALRDVDVAILEADLDRRYLAAPRLRWVHCAHAGLTRSAMPEVFEKGLIVTGSAGRSAEALAQHVFFFALALTFDAYGLHDEQSRHSWRALADYDQRMSLWGKTIGIIGLGHTGIQVAHLGRAFGMRVLAYRRQDTPTPEPVERLYSAFRGDSIDELLSESDVVAIAAHLSDETYHLISDRELKLMKPSAYLINLARGAIVDEAALIRALQSGTIAGAASDVFAQEPLPQDAPIWDAPNMMVTPHMTPPLPERTQRSVNTILENIRRYRSGEPMLNQLIPQDVFSRG